jgi:AcrR family transcriptional regulator
VKVLRKKNGQPKDTKRDILDVAGRLFKEYGYDKTTYRMIAEELNIAPSAIVYHFKSKPWIVLNLFNDCMGIIHNYVDANLTEGRNYYLYNNIVEICYYRESMRNKNVWDLFHHEDITNMWAQGWISRVETIFTSIADNFQKTFDPAEIHAISVMSIGARTSLFAEFYQHGNMSIDRCCHYMMYLMGVFSKLDEATIMRNIQRAFDFADSHEFPRIPLFE